MIKKIENINDTNNIFDVTKMYKVPSKLYNNENNINQDSTNVEIDHSMFNGKLLVNKLSKEMVRKFYQCKSFQVQLAFYLICF